MRSQRVLVVVISAALFAFPSCGAEQEEVGIRYQTFEKAVYALGYTKYLFKRRTSHQETLPFVALTFAGHDAEKNGAAKYNASHFQYEFDLQKTPRFSTNSGVLWIGYQGRPYMFGMREYNDPNLVNVLYDGNLRTRTSFFPVFAETSDTLCVGSKWELKAPPIAYKLDHAVTPPKEHSILRQEWLSTEELNGFQCARISYQIQDEWLDGEKGETYKFDITGVVYFAIREGVVVMETSHIDMSLAHGGKMKLQRRWSKNLILLHYEPAKTSRGETARQEAWRYAYRPPSQNTHSATGQAIPPRPATPPSKEEQPAKAAAPWKPPKNANR